MSETATFTQPKLIWDRTVNLFVEQCQMGVEFEVVLYFALKPVLFTHTVVVNQKGGTSPSTEKPARYCTQLPCCCLLSSMHLCLYLKASSLTLQLSCSESPSKVMSSGQLANQNGEKDWEHASNAFSPAALPEYTGKELIADFKISFLVSKKLVLV